MLSCEHDVALAGPGGQSLGNEGTANQGSPVRVSLLIKKRRRPYISVAGEMPISIHGRRD